MTIPKQVQMYWYHNSTAYKQFILYQSMQYDTRCLTI